MYLLSESSCLLEGSLGFVYDIPGFHWHCSKLIISGSVHRRPLQHGLTGAIEHVQSVRADSKSLVSDPQYLHTICNRTKEEMKNGRCTCPSLAVCGPTEILPPEESHAGVQATRPAANMQVRKAEVQVSAACSATVFVDKIYYIQKLILFCRAG